MKKLVILAIFVCIAESFAHNAVAFRYDDNQNPENWISLREVFQKHNARFSIAVNLQNMLSQGSEYHRVVCLLEEEGFEIMDHTPNHHTLLFRSSDKELIRRHAKDPFVDHTTENTLYFKFIPRMETPLRTWKVSLTNGCEITCDAPPVKPRPFHLVKIKDRYCFMIPEKKPGKLKLVSVWGEKNVNLPDAQDMELPEYQNFGIPCPGSVEFLTEQTQKAAAKIGLKKTPKVWIQPGGTQILFAADELAPILRKRNYVSASTYWNSAQKGLMDPHFGRNAYAMLWGPFTLEKGSLEPAKRQIADAIACHRAAIGISHILPACKGRSAMEKYVRLHDELLGWLEENNIKVLTQGELTKFLETAKMPPEGNIMPPLYRDINGDGIPDGYAVAGGAEARSGEIFFRTVRSSLQIGALCALPHGAAEFSLEAKGNFKWKILLEYFSDVQGLKAKNRLKTEKIVWDSNSANWQKFKRELHIPGDANSLRFSIVCEQGTGTCRNLVLRGTDHSVLQKTDPKK